jgi:hypothetical protein
MPEGITCNAYLVVLTDIKNEDVSMTEYANIYN